MIAGRLIQTKVDSAVDNMSIDAALLQTAKSNDPPTLRFYGWQQPTVSLGYFQRLEDRDQHPPSSNLPCVRRASGGGAIVHHHELTYAVVLPNDLQLGAPQQTGDSAELAGRASSRNSKLTTSLVYQQLHAAIIEALSDHGITSERHDQTGRCDASNREKCNSFLCFARRSEHDLIVSGYKVVGSAQRRSKTAVMQHGSILLKASEYAPELPGIENLTSRPVDQTRLSDSITQHLSTMLKIDWRGPAICISNTEADIAKQIAKTKFGESRWTAKR